MTLYVNIIRKVSGNTTVVYNGFKSTPAQQIPASQPEHHAPAKIRTIPPRSVKQTTTAQEIKRDEVSTVTLKEKATSENTYKFFAQYLTDQLKKTHITKNSFLIIGGLAFPARVIRDVLRNLKNELVTLSIDHATKTAQIAYNCDGLRGRSTIKTNFSRTPHLIPVI